MRRLYSLLLPVLALVPASALLAGCGSSGHASSSPTTTAPASPATSPATSSPAPAAASVIVIKNFSYSPATLTVSPGAEVTVKNEDTAPHTVTATSPHSGAFDTGNVQPGSSKTFKAPTTAGTYPYICTIHQFMHGTLVVR